MYCSISITFQLIHSIILPIPTCISSAMLKFSFWLGLNFYFAAMFEYNIEMSLDKPFLNRNRKNSYPGVYLLEIFDDAITQKPAFWLGVIEALA
ncbi:hypothetical protein VNO77_01511 [Canavalia gladiata]|uniref:Uncharacterized protein n=1 Tax=Canavalia gladiata TaxID=3824 RepID=A0AAN9MRD2_CANGL